MPVLNTLQSTATTAKDKAATSVNKYVTPSQRAEIYNTVRDWCQRNPKLAAFIAAQALLGVPPILIFTIFTLAFLLSSLAFALVVALLVTGFAVGCAFLLLLPVLFGAVCVATWLWVMFVVSSWIFGRFSSVGVSLPSTGKGAKGTQSENEWDGLWSKGKGTNGISNGGSDAVTYATS